MVWLDIADQIDHLYDYKTSTGKRKYMRVYFKLNELVNKIKSKLEREVLFMIVSDYGKGHRDEAYFSLNKNIRWSPDSILSYSSFIREILS